jgi:tetratricopeptide (TPR) repeat protein
MLNPKYDLFLSYSPLDAEIVQTLASELNNAGLNVWFDRWKLVPGQNWESSIEKAMEESAAIGFCIGPKGTERWSERYLSLALFIQKQNPAFKIIPVLLPGANPSDVPPQISRIQYLNLVGGAKDLAAIARLKTAIGASFEKSAVKVSAKRDPLISNIPRRPYFGFVVRHDSEGRNIVGRLREDLAPERNQLVVLHGPGGVGKTTVAAETARSLSDLFGGRIAWISAEGRGGFALSTLLDDAAKQLGREDLRQLGPEQKAEGVAALLAAERPLIVLDNFETIAAAEQAQCVEFLSQRANCPVLITTRQKIASAQNITIPVMDSAEAHEFLKRLIAQASDPSAFTQVDLERVKQVSERNPLVMQWVVAQIDLAQQADTVLDELVHGAGDAAQRVFDHPFELEYLGDDGRAVLLALSLFVPDASQASLAEVSGFGADLRRLNEAIKRLASLSLVKKTADGSRLIIEGLTRELAKARLSKEEDFNELHRRFVAHFLSYAEAHGEPTSEDFDALEVEKDNAFSSMDLAFELGDWQTVTRLMTALSFDGVNGFLPVRGYWEEAATLGKRALQAARNLSDKAEVARFSHNLAITYQNRGELQEARRLYHESLEIEKKLGDQSGIAGTLHELGRLSQAQDELEEARLLYHESLEIKKRLGSQRGIAVTLHQLGRLAQDQGEMEEARRLYHESLGIKKKLGDQSGIAGTLHQLATLAQDQGEMEEARRLYHESLEIEKKLGNQSGIAITLHQLGTLAENNGDKDEAARLFRQALEIFEKLGSPYADIARRSLARLEGKSSEVP